MKRRRTKCFGLYGTIKKKEVAIEIDIIHFLLHECLFGITIPYAHSYAAYLGCQKSKHKTAESLMRASRQKINFYIPYDWTIK